ncbi:hypothetical protein GVAV_001329 [Gurleya vavrai]
MMTLIFLKKPMQNLRTYVELLPKASILQAKTKEQKKFSSQTMFQILKTNLIEILICLKKPLRTNSKAIILKKFNRYYVNS